MWSSYSFSSPCSSTCPSCTRMSPGPFYLSMQLKQENQRVQENYSLSTQLEQLKKKDRSPSSVRRFTSAVVN